MMKPVMSRILSQNVKTVSRKERAAQPVLCCGLLLSLLLLSFSSSALGQDDPLFRVVFKNNEVFAGKAIRNWDGLGKNPDLDGRALADPANPIRFFQNLTINEIKPLTAPYIELTNGDVLPGKVLEVVEESPHTNTPEHAVVSLGGSVHSWLAQEGTVRIRFDRIRRIVLAETTNGDLRPGQLVLIDGRVVPFTRHRFTASGVRVLNDEANESAAWNEVAEFYPAAESILTSEAAILDDLLAPCPTPDSRLGRITTDDGAVLTFREAMLVPERSVNGMPHHGVQPTWALDIIRVNFAQIAMISFREHNQIALSMLPARTLAESSATGFVWRWQRDRSIRNRILASGTAVADFGVGSHSYSEISFAMPMGATTFSASVGIDKSVDRGGCVQVRILRGAEQIDQNPAWQSGYLIGKQEPVAVSVPLTGFQQVVLVTDYGHDGRPAGSDPFDIRDEVNWMAPLVTIDMNIARQNDLALEYRAMQLTGWDIAEADLNRFQLGMWFNPAQGRWITSLEPKQQEAYEASHVVLTLARKVAVSEEANWIPVSLTGSGTGANTLVASVDVNGEPLASVSSGDASASGAAATYAVRAWDLNAFNGQDVDLTIKVSLPTAGTYQMRGFSFDSLGVVPYVDTDNGKPLTPAIELTSLNPTEFTVPGREEMPPADKVNDETPLTIMALPVEKGYSFPPGTTLTYVLDPDYTRFQALLGMTSGTSTVGPIEILVDEEVIWSSLSGIGGTGQFSLLTRPYQLDLELPMGASAMQIKTGGGGGAVTFGYAGFVK